MVLLLAQTHGDTAHDLLFIWANGVDSETTSPLRFGRQRAAVMAAVDLAFKNAGLLIE